jgi:TolB-like protein
VRRLLAVVLVVLGLPLVAASPNVFYAKPTVIVYPFVSNGSSSIDREASSRLATIIATQMAATGKVTVTPPPPGTERKDYLSAARAHNADYYITGYISPLGSGVSMVEQVVSASSGIVVFSQSAQLTTYNDAAGQGDDLASFISNHANRGLAAVPTTPPQSSSPTPVPSTGPEANLGKLFSRRKKAAATPAPAPKPASSAPAATVTNVTTPAPAAARAVAVAPPPPPPGVAGYAVLPVEGAPDAALREHAEQRLLSATKGERVATLAAACAKTAPKAVLTGILGVKADGRGGTTAIVELRATDCAGKVLWQQSRSSDATGSQSQAVAIDRAVEAVVGAYMNPPRRRR